MQTREYIWLSDDSKDKLFLLKFTLRAFKKDKESYESVLMYQFSTFLRYESQLGVKMYPWGANLSGSWLSKLSALSTPVSAVNRNPMRICLPRHFEPFFENLLDSNFARCSACLRFSLIVLPREESTENISKYALKTFSCYNFFSSWCFLVLCCMDLWLSNKKQLI